MSFSSDIKKELCALHVRTDLQKLFLLSGLTHCCGSLRLMRPLAVTYHTEQLPVARLIMDLGKALFGEADAVLEKKQQEHRKRPLLDVRISGRDTRRLMLATGVLTESDDGFNLSSHVPDNCTAGGDAARCFVRGCFLASGVCVDPVRRYHVEILCRSEAFCAELIRLLADYGITAKMALRKGRHVLYCREGDDVMSFLALIGANVAALQFENVRAEKETRNYANRTTNCDAANMGKVASASATQLQAIEHLSQRNTLRELPAPLFEAAELRINHPESTLQELADLAGIKKSGMNHRLQRLVRLAEDMGYFLR